MIYFTEFGMMDTEIEQLVSDRLTARQHKDFLLADTIRGRLHDHGITIEDRQNGTTHWYKFRRPI